MEYLDSLFMAYDENNLKQKKLVRKLLIRLHIYTQPWRIHKKSQKI